MIDGKLRTVLAAAACAVAAGLLGLFPARQAHAHPHAWIELTVQVLFDDSGKAVGLRETWLFDEYYTVFATGARGGKPSQDQIDAVLRGNMKNLKSYGYFTKVEHGGADVAFAAVTEMSSALRGGRLGMTFTVPFESPLDLKGSSLVYAIFDPTYYTAMLHAESDDAIRLERAPAGCAHRLIEPNPGEDAASFAASLDRTQSAGDGLGALFAQRVAVECP